MAALSEWLQIMLAEIARKREDLERGREEERTREHEAKETEAKVDDSSAQLQRVVQQR
jgi:hypothetical protein